jgi:O-acetyl-ADP-ribose deacetylase (regulator of RNase III)
MKNFAISATCAGIVQLGDITKVEVDAIVNAANERMLGGLGVDGAIHLWAGRALEAACQEMPEIRPGVRCPRGEAKITPGFNLPCQYVIHAVGPIYESQAISAPILESAYRSSLELANLYRLATIAFPAISCGVYGYPMDEAASVAFKCCREHFGKLEQIRFVLFEQPHYEIWLDVAEQLFGSLP